MAMCRWLFQKDKKKRWGSASFGGGETDREEGRQIEKRGGDQKREEGRRMEVAAGDPPHR